MTKQLDEYQLIARNIQKVREEQGLTVEQLAADCRIKTIRLYRIEEGEHKFNLAILIRIARRLGVRPAALLDGVK